jgi:hypothetical protein
MRLAGGMLGGVWPAHLAADLGNGQFDGAILVQNFENLRPEGVWRKYDQLYAQPDRESGRFLEFERWWNGFYKLGREEILTIVRELFIGNQVEKGEVVIDGHCRADLSQVRTPLVIFCSKGDNVTPPAQALGWLKTVFGATDELIRAGQRIVYLVHEHVGHLGIFVSADVALREHRSILHHARQIQALAPGLYEMTLDPVIDDATDAARATFAPRRIEDLPYEARPAAFERVNDLSVRLDGLYSQWVSPWVQTLSNPLTARCIEWAQPMRTSRLVWSERFVPIMAALPVLSQTLQAHGCRDEQREANPWYGVERGAAQATTALIETWRHLRDRTTEIVFQGLYGS